MPAPRYAGLHSHARTAAAAMAVAAALLGLMATPVAAAPPMLTAGSATPTSGGTSTLFQFSVHYTTGTSPREATSATATLGNATGTTLSASLALTSGGPLDGTWTGSRTLPAGSWTVTFTATVASGGEPAPLVLPQPVVVTPPPTPTPAPTPPPTPTPVVTATPVPTPAPTPFAPTPMPSGLPSATPGSAEPSATGASGSGEPSGGASASQDGSGTSSASGSAAPGGGPDGDDGVAGQLTTFLTGGVAAIGLLAAVGFAAIYADRRRNKSAGAGRAAGSGGPGTRSGFPTPGAPPPARPPKPRAAWEDYALDDEPIGTIEYEPPANE